MVQSLRQPKSNVLDEESHPALGATAIAEHNGSRPEKVDPDDVGSIALLSRDSELIAHSAKASELRMDLLLTDKAMEMVNANGYRIYSQ